MASTLSPRTIADPQVASVRCAVQWVASVLTLGVKMSVMAFCPLEAKKALSPSWAWPEVAGELDCFLISLLNKRQAVDSLAFIGVYLLPVLFVVFTARARAAMRPAAAGSLSIEAALHAELALSLALDFLDVSIVFTEALEKDMLLRSLSPIPAWRWTTFVVLILSLVSAVSLGFAFPANLSDASVASGQADIFISAKFEFLVGLLLVDVPFLVIRIYWMLITEKVYWFVLKNVFSIFVRPLKLNQCRLAERERAKGTQRTIYEAPPTVRQQQLHKQQQQEGPAAAEGKQQQPQQNAAASAAAAVGRGVLSNIQRLRQRGSLLRQRRPGGGAAAADLQRTELPLAHSSRDFDSSFHPGSSLGSNLSASSSNSSSDREVGDWPRRKGAAAVGVIAAAAAAAAAADAPQKLSRRQRALLRDLKYSRRIPVSSIGCGNALERLLVLLFRCRGRGLSGLLDGDTYLSYGQQLRFAAGGLLLILARMLLVFFAAGAAAVGAAGSGALATAKIVVSAGPRFAVWLMLSACFLALPVCDFLAAWAYVPLSLCGKRFFSLSRDKRVKATSMPVQRTEAGGRASPSLVYVSLSNAVILSLCRQGAAPLSLHALLVGPDTVKGLRLSEALLEAFSLDLALAAILRLWALCEHLSWLNFCAFGCHLLVGLLYLLLSQAALSLALRRHEVMLTVEDLIRHRTDDLSIFDEGDSSGDELQQQQQQRLKGSRTTASSFITVADEAELFQRDGYVSSAVTVFPRIV
ncbi:hypothetical protein Esti_001810 [Eimeria stiedai]